MNMLSAKQELSAIIAELESAISNKREEMVGTIRMGDYEIAGHIAHVRDMEYRVDALRLIGQYIEDTSASTKEIPTRDRAFARTNPADIMPVSKEESALAQGQPVKRGRGRPRKETQTR